MVKKQTTNISQMIQAIEGNATIMAALPTMGLDDYLTDLKQKNEAFAAKMAERTAGTVGQEKGVVAAARTEVEKALRNLIRATNVVSIYEGDGGLDSFIDTMNAEIEHFKDILARKGYSSGSSNSGTTNGGNSGTTEPTDPGTTDPTPGTTDPTDPGTTPTNPTTPDPDPGTGGGGTSGGDEG
jgi:hypothetical protein